MKYGGPPPVVFLGPSAPAEDVSSLWPEAMIVPPIRRNDLYRYRILKYSLFVNADGAFIQNLAVPPREVVDVMRDGATVIGVSSMGALRAADCAPAGAIGLGRISRLFRQRRISSEVNAGRLVAAAEALHYGDRTWRQVFDAAELRLDAPAKVFLESVDAKRHDLRHAIRQIALGLKNARLSQGAPRSGAEVFGLLGEGRERSYDPLDGARREDVAFGFAVWMVLSEQLKKLHASPPRTALEDAEIRAVLEPDRTKDLLDQLGSSAELDAALLRYTTFCRALALCQRLDIESEQRDQIHAKRELAAAHNADSWHDLNRRFQHSPETKKSWTVRCRTSP